MLIIKKNIIKKLMKLPIISKIKKKRHNTISNGINNLKNKNYYLNYFILPNNNISSIGFIKTQHYINHINNFTTKKNFYNEKEKEKEKEILIKNYKFEKYIKNTLNSVKIKKEISSFLYSTPDKQQRFINYLSNKFDGNKEININENCNMNDSKIRRRFIKIKQNSIRDNYINNKDEDRTNLKEFYILIGDKKSFKNEKIKINSKIKNMRNDNKKYIECWDNNILKNILPKNFRSFQKNNKNDLYNNIDDINSYELNTFNHINNDKTIYNYNNMKYKKNKYTFDNGAINIKKNYNKIYTKRFTRSSSNF